MQASDGETRALSPDESWNTIHETMDSCAELHVCRRVERR